jgi:chemotaxis-related protein WspD
MSAQPGDAGCWNKIGVGGDRSCPRLSTFIHCRHCDVVAAAARQSLRRPVDEAYREQWARQLRMPLPQRVTADRSGLVFRIGREWLALPARVIDTVAPLAPLHRVPHRTGAILLGVVNIEGRLVPALSLAALLGIDENEAPASSGRRSFARLLVLDWEGQLLALPVADLHGIVRYAAPMVQAPAATIDKGVARFLAGVLPHAGMQVGLLDPALTGAALERQLR